MDQRLKCKNYAFARRKLKQNAWGLCIRKRYFGKTLKAQGTKAKSDKWGYITVKSFCTLNKAGIRMKR